MRLEDLLHYCPLRLFRLPQKSAVLTGVILLAATAGVTAQGIPALANPGYDTAGLANTTTEVAGSGIAEAIRLGGNYLTGKGVPKDLVQSAYWFRKAADQGDAEAQNELGYFYFFGIGVPRDYTESARWFARAIASGSQSGKLNLAVMYLKGAGVAPDLKFGASLLDDLARRGNARAEYYLGAIYFSGYGVRADHSVAEKWFARSAKGKSPEGEYSMGILYSVTEDHEHNLKKAAGFLRRSARGGFVPAMATLGMLLTRHPEIGQKRPDEAISMLRQAAEAGDWESSATLGAIARDGSAAHGDLREACRWFTIAKKQGGAEAEKYTRADLSRCQQSLSGDQHNLQLEEAENWLGEHPGSDLYVFSDGLTVPLL